MPPRKKWDKMIPSSYQMTFQVNNNKHESNSYTNSKINSEKTSSVPIPEKSIENTTSKGKKKIQRTQNDVVDIKVKKKACLRCRKAKVKCINDGIAPCKRCFLNDVECVFHVQVESSSASHVSPLPVNGTAVNSFNNENIVAKSTNTKPTTENAQSIKNENNISWQNSMENNLDDVKDTLNNIFNFLKDGKFHNKLPHPDQVIDKTEIFNVVLQHLQEKNINSNNNGNAIQNRKKSFTTPNEPEIQSTNGHSDNIMFQFNHPSFENNSISEYERMIYGNVQRDPLERSRLPNGNISNCSNLYNINYEPQIRPQSYQQPSEDTLKRTSPDTPESIKDNITFKKQKILGISNEIDNNEECVISFECFEAYFKSFCSKIEPFLFGFEFHKFNKIMIYLKSEIMVNFICFLGSFNSLSIGESQKFKTAYYNCVSKVLMSSDDLSTYEELNILNYSSEDSIYGSDASTKDETTDNSDLKVTETEYNKYIQLVLKKGMDPHAAFKSWKDLSHLEKLEEHEASKQFKLFMKILSLILGAFWIESSQRFFGLAVQLAADLNISDIFSKISTEADIVDISNNSDRSKDGSLKDKISKDVVSNDYVISKIDKLKLWYLLYILDSQQAVFFKKSKIISTSNVIENPRRFIFSSSLISLPQDDEKALLEDSENTTSLDRNESQPNTLNEKLINSTGFYNNFSLVSHLEFSKAISLILQGSGMSLLNPESFGIPWKTNLDLDRWMVHWTCLLTPINQSGNPWIIKQTMIYYNFAKLHLNHELASHSSCISDMEESRNNIRTIEPTQNIISGMEIINQEDEIKDINSEDIALLSAQTLIESIVKDDDIKQNLPFSPIHIHIMLYFSAICLLNSSKYYFGNIQQFSNIEGVKNNSKDIKINLRDIDKKKFETLINSYIEKLILIKSVIDVLNDFLPIDIEFGKKLVKELKNKLNMRIKMMRKISDTYSKTFPIESDSNITPLEDEEDLSKVLNQKSAVSESNTRTKFLAWPSTNHGHP